MSLIDAVNDTVAALATPPGRGGIAVVKISGPEAVAIARGVIDAPSDPASHPRRMIHATIHQSGTPIDEALVCVMPGPHSYTGEDVVEIQTHGGYAAADAVLSLLIERGVRQALPGEFTRRAFLNGRIDLAQAEGVMQVVEADNRAALSVARELLDGDFSLRIEEIVARLSDMLSNLEAAIDFSEDVDNSGIDGHIAESISETVGMLDGMIESRRAAERIRHGITVVLAGPVNAGKSSLFNALLGKSRALVNSEPGTTRDWIESLIELDGIPFNLIDTAGFRETGHDVEQAGIRETARLTETADIIIRLHHAPDEVPAKPIVRSSHQAIIHVSSKSDMYERASFPDDILLVSVVTGDGLSDLKSTLTTLGTELIGSGAYAPVMVDRHRQRLYGAREHLLAASGAIDTWSEEILSLELRDAITHLESILGRNIDFDILETIFSKFCIGK